MLQLFKHILVPLDFTTKNQVALRFALKLAKQNHADVTLLHLIETIDYADDGEIATFYETLKHRARAHLATYIEQFQAAGVPVADKIVLGKRAHGIISYSVQQNTDLIVLSSHKVKLEDGPQSWATLSHQVSILSQCPVLLVK